jgi:O-antigen/teichoic acid export membrane protein
VSAAIRRFLGEFLVVGAGKIVSLGALFACAIVVARFSGPEEFGRFAAALTIVLLLDVAIGGPLDFAAVRFSAMHRDDAPRVARFHGATFRIKAVLVIALLGIAALVRAPLGTLLFDDPDSGALVLWCLAATASLVVLRSTLAWLQTATRFREYAAVDVLNGLLRIGAMVAVGLAGMRSAEAFLAVLAIAIAGTYIASLFVIRQPYLTAPRASREDVRAILGFFGATAGILILGTFTGRSDVFFVKRMVSAEAAGFYAAAAQVASIITMLASYACVILQPRLMHAGRASIRRLALVSVGIGALAALVLLPAAHFAGAWGMALVFGDAFAVSAGVLVVLLIGTCLDLIFMPVLMTLSLQTRARASLMGEVVITAVFIGLIVALGDRGAMTIAWIATGIRGLKLVLYSWLALTAPGIQSTSNAGRSA